MLKHFLLVALLVVFLSPQVASADGAAFIPGPYDNRWDYNRESSQSAIIDYKSGTQKMLLSVGFENSKENTVWLFPVPSVPEKIVVDVLDDVPSLYGENIADGAKANLLDARKGLLATQLYPIPWALRSSYKSFEGTGLGATAGFGLSDGVANDVTVHESLEKNGMTTQIITAKTSVGLFKYLRELNLDIKGGSIPALDEYVGKDFSFVVSWIMPEDKVLAKRLEVEDKLLRFINNYFQDGNGIKPSFLDLVALTFPSEYSLLQASVYEDQSYLKNNPAFKEKLVDLLMQNLSYVTDVDPYYYDRYERKVRGVFVSFPTPQIYYPLKLTSVYGSEVIPTDIRIMGYVKPELYPDIAPYVTTEYYFDADYYPDYRKANPFEWVEREPMRYTKIKLKAPSKLFREDLFFSPKSSLGLWCQELITRSAVIPFIPLFLIISFLSGILAALLAFWGRLETKRKLWKYGFLSWLNIFSIIMFAFWIFYSRTKSLDENQKQLLANVKAQGLSTWSIHSRDYGRKVLFVFLFSLIYIILALIIPWLIVQAI